MNYLALGDSISIDDYTGVISGGAASQFARLIQAQAVEDLTSDGQTTEGVLEALRRVSLRPDIITLTAGGNDFLQAAFQPSPLPNVFPPEHWQQIAQAPLQNLQAIAARLAAFRCPVIVNTI